MMPELGKYAGTVLSAYGITILLIAGLVIVSASRNAAARRKLDALEKRRRNET